MSDQATRILVVAERPARLEAARTALENAGHSVRSASAGTALAVIREWLPDAVLLDVSGDKRIERIAAVIGVQRAAEVLPLATMERRWIEAALHHTNNDVPRAAALLQINPSTIYRKLHAWRAEAAAGQS